MTSETSLRLPPEQVEILEAFGNEEQRTIAELSEWTGIEPETVTGAVFALEDEGVIDIHENTDQDATLTTEGRRYSEDGLPETRLHEAASLMGGVDDPIPLGEVIEQADLSGDAVDIALANFARKGYGSIEDGSVVLNHLSIEDDEAEALAALSEGGTLNAIDENVLAELDRRNLIDISERTTRAISLTEAGRERVEAGIAVTDELGAVTPDVLTSGAWKDRTFRPYNVEAEAPTEIGGSEHPLRRMAERVKDVLVGMGFQEMEGPHVDADFWINDCLFMPQDHPARTHWDRFELESPAEIEDLPPELVDRVETAHRQGVGGDGQGYHSPWEEPVARALALRGHTTSLSARYLSGEAIGDLEPPQRFFSVEKVYRNDTLDATHLLEFFQIEGWVMADALSVRDLMGTFTEFYEHFGITDLEFKPHYNPYTEPSFELFGTHPRTGELIEIGNSGIFRPEMLEPLGVDCDVMAWGLALERLMMLVTGAEDIRDVHGTLVDLDFLRTQEVQY